MEQACMKTLFKHLTSCKANLDLAKLSLKYSILKKWLLCFYWAYIASSVLLFDTLWRFDTLSQTIHASFGITVEDFDYIY